MMYKEYYGKVIFFLIFNKNYIERNREKYKDITLKFITGSDCHIWADYPEENDDFSFTYLKCKRLLLS